jgi:hypothetical protein
MNKIIVLLSIILLLTLVSLYAVVSSGWTRRIPYTITEYEIISVMLFVEQFLLPLIFLIDIELLVGYAFVYKIKNYKRILTSIAIAVFISFSFVLFSINIYAPTFQSISPWLYLMLCALLKVIFETFFIYIINRKFISLKRTIIISICMNLTSIFLGLVVIYFSGLFTPVFGL